MPGVTFSGLFLCPKSNNMKVKKSDILPFSLKVGHIGIRVSNE
jgi:hypothetical protein